MCSERAEYLEVVVLVDGASGAGRHFSHGGQVQVLTGEQEEIHAAPLGHTVFSQLLIHTFLRLKQELWKRIKKGTDSGSVNCFLIRFSTKSKGGVYCSFLFHM